MGLEVNSDEEKNICTRNILQENELQKILENNSESEECESLIVDNNIDAFRVKRSIMPGKCIVDMTYVFEHLHEKFDEHVAELNVVFVI